MSVRRRIVALCLGHAPGGAPAHAPAWSLRRCWPAAVAVVATSGLAIAVATAPPARRQPEHAPAAFRGALVGAPAPAARGARGSVSAAGTSGPGTSAPVAFAVPPAGAEAVAIVMPRRKPKPARPAQQAPADPATVSSLAADGIPTVALAAYRAGAARANAASPSCHLPWPLLAGIGRIESDHGRFDGSTLLADGTTSKRILGIQLPGPDTDHGRLDGDTQHDRAVGPMQFIPSTWVAYGIDGDRDGVADPSDIWDAAATAARYLCAAGGNLSTLAGQTRAVLAYNHSNTYVDLVLNLEKVYAVGVPGLTVPVLPVGRGVVAPAPKQRRPTLPPVDPGPPLAAPGAKPMTRPTNRPARSSPVTTAPRPTSTHPSLRPSSPPAPLSHPSLSQSASPAPSSAAPTAPAASSSAGSATSASTSASASASCSPASAPSTTTTDASDSASVGSSPGPAPSSC